jgi:hypothetical protein
MWWIITLGFLHYIQPFFVRAVFEEVAAQLPLVMAELSFTILRNAACVLYLVDFVLMVSHPEGRKNDVDCLEEFAAPR